MNFWDRLIGTRSGPGKDLKISFLGNLTVGKTKIIESLKETIETLQLGTSKVYGADLKLSFKDNTFSWLYERNEPVSSELILSNSSMVILCFSLIDRQSVISLVRLWMPLINHSQPCAPVIVIGTHADERDSRVKVIDNSNRKRTASFTSVTKESKNSHSSKNDKNSNKLQIPNNGNTISNNTNSGGGSSSNNSTSTIKYSNSTNSIPSTLDNINLSLEFYSPLYIPSEHPIYCASNLNAELLLIVFSYLSLPDLASAMCVCRTWNKVGNHNYTWEHRKNVFCRKEKTKELMQELKSMNPNCNSFVEFATQNKKDTKNLISKLFAEAKKA
eukprot:TRINITY_DN6167_c0_g1_i2.p1 TRINITY_DN6167_c0_g1~~TRINITY_DN6167_c0_g1_i2.p1  ORF type:complete len:330 (-),score=120.81 TRINITY_DN6167_c0_g1_i2:172-1161(-)